MVAFVKCKGTCDKANVQYNYYGMDDCVKIAAAVPGAGDKACSYGCLGSGSCVKACQFDAIHIVDGVAVVDKEKCVACGACAAVCPRHLIDLVPYKAEHLVQCNSHDKGADVKKKCDAGCIGCTLCTKQCEADAIHMDNNVAVIDYEKCTNCGKCAEKCPAKVILIAGQRLAESDSMTKRAFLAGVLFSFPNAFYTTPQEYSGRCRMM